MESLWLRVMTPNHGQKLCESDSQSSVTSLNQSRILEMPSGIGGRAKLLDGTLFRLALILAVFSPTTILIYNVSDCFWPFPAAHLVVYSGLLLTQSGQSSTTTKYFSRAL